MKAFVGHSFDEKDQAIVRQIKDFIEDTGISCKTGEKAENRPIPDKIREKILDSDIFVGIFTCGEEIMGENISRSIFGSKRKGSGRYTTSNWVIQESGFAIGKDKELIFLVEKGVHNFPELQGNLERIPFERISLDKIYPKLNQMLQTLKERKNKGITSEVKSSIEGSEKLEAEKEKETPKEQQQKIKKIGILRILDAITEGKGYKEVQELYAKEIEPSLPDEEKPVTEAVLLRHSGNLGDNTAFEKLIEHVNKNKTNPDVVLQLAQRYKEMREYEKAKDTFLSVGGLFDLNRDDEKKKILRCYEEASHCLTSGGKSEESIKLLLSLLHKAEFNEFKARILASLAEIARTTDDLDRFFIFAEGSLNLDPSNTDLRFHLALKYSEKSLQKMSLLHNKKLTDTEKSPGGLNNLGVQYAELNLPAMSIRSYFKSADHNNTIAMSNIAQKYLGQGFVDDADRIIRRANDLAKDGIEVDGSVGVAKTRLVKILDDENKREKELLIETEKEREFRVKYSEAFYTENSLVTEKLAGIWETRWGNFKLNFKEDKTSFTVDESERTKWEGFASLLMSSGGPEVERYKTKYINVKGALEKFSGKFRIEISEEIDYQNKFIPLEKKKIYEGDGYMVVSENGDVVDVMEISEKKEVNISIWRKKSD